MRSRLIRVAATVAVAGLALAGGAVAAPPDHFTDAADYSGGDSCGTFSDMFEGHLDISGITTYDKAGNPLRDVVHLSGWERNWRSDMPTVSITSHRSWTVIYTYATDTERNAGNILTTTFAGEGVLFHDVGNLIVSPSGIVVHGPHDVFDQGGAAFCNALLAATP